MFYVQKKENWARKSVEMPFVDPARALPGISRVPRAMKLFPKSRNHPIALGTFRKMAAILVRNLN